MGERRIRSDFQARSIGILEKSSETAQKLARDRISIISDSVITILVYAVEMK
jgi:hypothetical protein